MNTLKSKTDTQLESYLSAVKNLRFTYKNSTHIHTVVASLYNSIGWRYTSLLPGFDIKRFLFNLLSEGSTNFAGNTPLFFTNSQGEILSKSFNGTQELYMILHALSIQNIISYADLLNQLKSSRNTNTRDENNKIAEEYLNKFSNSLPTTFLELCKNVSVIPESVVKQDNVKDNTKDNTKTIPYTEKSANTKIEILRKYADNELRYQILWGTSNLMAYINNEKLQKYIPNSIDVFSNKLLVDGVIAYERIFDKSGTTVIAYQVLDAMKLIPSYNSSTKEQMWEYIVDEKDFTKNKIFSKNSIVYISSRELTNRSAYLSYADFEYQLRYEQGNKIKGTVYSSDDIIKKEFRYLKSLCKGLSKNLGVLFNSKVKKAETPKLETSKPETPVEEQYTIKGKHIHHSDTEKYCLYCGEKKKIQYDNRDTYYECDCPDTLKEKEIRFEIYKVVSKLEATLPKPKYVIKKEDVTVLRKKE